MGQMKRIFATLNMRHVELPYATAAEQAEADAINAQIRSLGFRTSRMAYDWGYSSYGAKSLDKAQPLKSGDLVRVFKTVTSGTKAWEGVIDLDYGRYNRGTQKDFDEEKWAHMFYRRLPARMQRGDTVIFGALEPFCETGTEGVVWSVHEYGKAGYDGLNCLEDGDRLTIYSRVTNGEVEWEGPVDFGPEAVSKAGHVEVMRQANHMKTEDWLQMNWQRRPVIITPQ